MIAPFQIAMPWHRGSSRCSSLPLVAPGSLRPLRKVAGIEANLITDFERWDATGPRHSFDGLLVEPKHVGNFFDLESVLIGCEPAGDAQHLLWRRKRFVRLGRFSRV